MTRFLSLFPVYRRLVEERDQLAATVSRLSADIDHAEARAVDIEDVRAFHDIERIGWQNVRQADRVWYETEIEAFTNGMAEFVAREFYSEDLKERAIADLAREAEAALAQTPPAPAVVLPFRRKLAQ